MLRFLVVFPLLAIPFAIYLFSGWSAGTNWLTSAVFAIPLRGELRVALTGGSLFLMLAIVCLFVEIIKAVDTSRKSLTNHGLSVGLLLTSLVAFLSLEFCATSDFFLFLLLLVLDVVGGFVITASAARRDFAGLGVTSVQ